jgi:hypothetical protein
MRIVAAILERSKPNWFKRQYLSLTGNWSEYDVVCAVMNPNNLKELKLSVVYNEIYRTNAPCRNAGKLNSEEMSDWVIYVYFTCKKNACYKKLLMMIADSIAAHRSAIAPMLDEILPFIRYTLPRYLDWA